MLKGNQMQTSIKLTEKQLALLLQVLDEQISVGNIEASEQALASEVLDILETAENKITSLY
jgi:DNA-binding Xre family transcriptional regulator